MIRRLPCFVIFIALLVSPAVEAYVEVRHHNISCDSSFPCPTELRRRVDFWIDVYSRWDSQNAILHDPSTPHRVYKVVEGRSCGGKANASFIRDQKKFIAGRLYKIANNRDKNISISDAFNRHLAGLFRGNSSTEIRTAAQNIRCQSGNKDGFKAALHRYGIYGPMVRRILREAELPPDVQYLPFVESSYNPKAFSRVGAAGLWQIMPATGQTLGLKLDASLDERLDPEFATWAATRYLKKARKTLTRVGREKNPRISDSSISPFVITSYNYGVNGMRRAIKKLGPDYMKVLNQYRSSSFQVAVKNFYSGFLAARFVAQNATRFFGEISPGEPLSYTTVRLNRPVSIGRIKSSFGLGETKLKELNPALTRFIWNEWRFVPKDYLLRLPNRKNGWKKQAKILFSMPRETQNSDVKNYIVQNGDTACGIAAAFRVDCRELINVNKLGRNAVIKVGQKLKIIPGKNKYPPVAEGGTYVVRKGDSACLIAKRFGVDCDDLLSVNSLDRSSTLNIKEKLIIPGTLKVSKEGRYTVVKGDHACGIANRIGINCNSLLMANNLSLIDIIYPGQTLTIPKINGTSKGKVNNAVKKRKVDISYMVVLGDTACSIASKYQIPCQRLISDNKLDKNGLIMLGQKLIIKGVPESIAAQHKQKKINDETVTLVADFNMTSSELENKSKNTKVFNSDKSENIFIDLLDQPFNLAVQTSVLDGKKIYRINVEPEETLGHYSDWLRLGGTEEIRELNGFDNSSMLVSGEALLIPVKDLTHKSEFEQRRTEYHRILVEEFKENFRFIGTDKYTINPGDALWGIARNFELPVWIITRFNPKLMSSPPKAGDVLQIPRIETKKI